MAASGFTWKIEKQNNATVVVMRGVLDESAPLDELAQRITGSTTFDVFDITTITSMGIRGWLAFMESIASKGTYHICRCPPFFVTQMNMIPNFTAGAIVDSVMLPYYCSACHAEKLEHLSLSPRDFGNPQSKIHLPHVNCSHCAQPMFFDELEARYFAFLTDPTLVHPRVPEQKEHTREVDISSRELQIAQAAQDAHTGAILLNDVRQVLNESCEKNSAVTVSLSDVARVLSGAFFKLEEDGVLVSLHGLSGLPSADDIRLGQHCVVTFYHALGPVFFLTTITDRIWPNREEKRPLLELALPRQIAKAEVRRALRIPIPEDSGVSVVLNRDDERSFKPLLRNLSLTGMLVAFNPTIDPIFSDLERVEVVITFNTTTVRLRGVVCRKEQDQSGVRYGVSFPESCAPGIMAPSSALKSIIDHFEGLWLKRLSQRS